MNEIKYLLKELIEDIKNDRYLHKGKVFVEWKKRHGIKGITISDVSPLLDERGENQDNETILKEFNYHKNNVKVAK